MENKKSGLKIPKDKRKKVELIKQFANEFHNSPNNEVFGRFRSWEHCHEQFQRALKMGKPDYDYLALHLANYLASWGMLRNSFLLQKDYKVHIDPVKILLKKEYRELYDVHDIQSAWEKIECLKEQLIQYYHDYGAESKNGITQTLLTKILLGTTGCTPAFDNNLRKALRNMYPEGSEFYIPQSFGMDSFCGLWNLYKDNSKLFEPVRKKMNQDGFHYTPMKILDMGLWTIGDKIPNNKNKDKA